MIPCPSVLYISKQGGAPGPLSICMHRPLLSECLEHHPNPEVPSDSLQLGGCYVRMRLEEERMSLPLEVDGRTGANAKRAKGTKTVPQR